MCMCVSFFLISSVLNQQSIVSLQKSQTAGIPFSWCELKLTALQVFFSWYSHNSFENWRSSLHIKCRGFGPILVPWGHEVTLVISTVCAFLALLRSWTSAQLWGEPPAPVCR